MSKLLKMLLILLILPGVYIGGLLSPIKSAVVPKAFAAAGDFCELPDKTAGTIDANGNCVNKICGSLPEAFCQAVVGQTASPSNPLGGLKNIVDLIANTLIALYGIFAVVVLIISGVQISASAGNENAVKSAKSNILKVVTGLVLLISFRAILEIINNVFVGVNTTGNLFEAGAGGTAVLRNNGIPALLGNVMSIASFFAGIVSVIFIIVGGIRLITSAGSPEGVKGARKTITYAIAGLVLSISAYGILVFIQSQLSK